MSTLGKEDSDTTLTSVMALLENLTEAQRHRLTEALSTANA